jgi:hypothetical protein
MFSSWLRAIPVGYARQFNARGSILLSSRSHQKILPLGFSIEVSPNGPESEKKRQLILVDMARELGPNSLKPSKSWKSLKILSSPFSSYDRQMMAWWARSAMKVFCLMGSTTIDLGVPAISKSMLIES